jgi:hypothetical protein
LKQLPATAPEADPDKITRILEKLDQLSDDEVKALLEEKRALLRSGRDLK